MARPKKVILTNQSFEGAGGLAVFSDLEMVDIISVGAKYTGGRDLVIKSAHEELQKVARVQKITHVFGITYEWGKNCSRHPGYGVYHTCFVTGTGYKKQNRK